MEYAIMKTFVAFLILCCGNIYAEPLSMEELLSATVRVHSNGYRGTGVCVGYKENRYYILTNYHLIHQSTRIVSVEFFSNGKKTMPLRGYVKWKAYSKKNNVDFALVTVHEDYLKKFVPCIVPLAPRKYTAKRGDYFRSAGCPDGRWPMAFEGTLITITEDEMVFIPHPIGGQSGSGIFVNIKHENGQHYTHVAGLLTWTSGYKIRNPFTGMSFAKGVAIPVSKLYESLDKK